MGASLVQEAEQGVQSNLTGINQKKALKIDIDIHKAVNPSL